MFSDYCDHHRFQQPLRKWRCSAFFHQPGHEWFQKSCWNHEYILYAGLCRCDCFNGHRTSVCTPDPCSVRGIKVRTCLCLSIPDDLSARHTSVHDLHRYEFVYQCAGICHDRHDLCCDRCRGKLHTWSALYLCIAIGYPWSRHRDCNLTDALCNICALFSKKTRGI